MPACSRTRRSWTSPQLPRIVDALSEPTREAVWDRSAWVEVVTSASCTLTWENCATRSRSKVPTWRSTRTRASRRGASMLAVWASSLTAASRSITRSRNRSRSVDRAAERPANSTRATSHAMTAPTSTPTTAMKISMCSTVPEATDSPCSTRRRTGARGIGTASVRPMGGTIPMVI